MFVPYFCNHQSFMGKINLDDKTVTPFDFELKKSEGKVDALFLIGGVCLRYGDISVFVKK